VNDPHNSGREAASASEQPTAAGTGTGIGNGGPPAEPVKKGMPKKWLYIVLALAVLFVLMPYLLWQATWFGRPLNDEQMAKAFTDVVHPREAQHALSQVADRMENSDPAVRASAKMWYPRVVLESTSPENALRSTAAWVMGKDPTDASFHEALQKLLSDGDPMVQRNAALSLVRFGDTSGHDLIISMLKPWQLASPAAGKVAERLTVGDTVNVGTLVGRIEAGGDKIEIRTQMPGTLDQWIVKEGAAVSAGQPIALLDPGSDVVLNSLAALYFIGHTDDVPFIVPYARGVNGMPPSVAQQATLTLDAIRNRAAAPARP
jgi:biotin carboxyl carrier protein